MEEDPYMENILSEVDTEHKKMMEHFGKAGGGSGNERGGGGKVAPSG